MRPPGQPKEIQRRPTVHLNLSNLSPVYGSDPRLEEQLAAAAAAGFDGVGLDLHSLVWQTGTLGGVAMLANRVAELGLTVLDITWVEVRSREVMPSAELIQEACATLRPRFLLVLLKERTSEALALLRGLAIDLANTGVRLALEFSPTTPVADLTTARAVIEAAHVPDLGVVLDSWHFHVGPSAWTDLEALDPTELAYVQLADVRPPEGDDVVHETRNRRTLPGAGIADLSRFTATLSRIGYAGPLSAEVLASELRTAPVAATAERIMRSVATYWPAMSAT